MEDKNQSPQVQGFSGISVFFERLDQTIENTEFCCWDFYIFIKKVIWK